VGGVFKMPFPQSDLDDFRTNIVALVAMYSLTNFFSNVFDPEKDFPAVAPAGSI
jgi:hypothetical protein